MEEKIIEEKPAVINEEEGEKKNRKELEAVVHIYTSFNNTIAHVTDMSGRTLAKVTGGMVTKHSRLKAKRGYSLR